MKQPLPIPFYLHALILAAVSGFSFGTISCGEDRSPERSAEKTAQSEVGRIATKATHEKPVDEVSEPTTLRPLPEPAAYFPNHGGERIIAPFEVPPVEKGSVVLIVVDALNARHLGVYGYKRDTSPAVDGLARDGVLFTNHVSNSSWTRPSYTTIITGLPRSRHGIELNDKKLSQKTVTIAERFRKAGYRTAAFVGNPLVNEIWGHGQGYQVYVDSRSLDKSFPLDEILVDKALSWLTRVGDQPFFLTLFLTAPHVSYNPPAEPRRFLKTVSEGEYNMFPFREYKEPMPKVEHDRIVAAYDDEIAYADSQIARLLDYLKEKQLAGRTVVALTADHGEAFGQHGCYGHTYHMWEPVLRVPLIISSPKMPRRGVTDDRPFTHIDIAPTLLASVGLEHSRDDLPGRLIIDTLADPKAGRSRTIVSQYNAYGIRRQAIRGHGMKLVHYDQISESSLSRLNNMNKSIERADPMDLPTLVRQLEGEHYELYDLVSDPGEEKDLYEARKGSSRIKKLLEVLAPMIPDRKPPPELSDEMLEALRNAGYFVPEQL